MTPCDTKASATTIDRGIKIYSVERTRSNQKLPIVCAGAPRQAADERDQDGDAGGGRDEVLHREAEHL